MSRDLRGVALVLALAGAGPRAAAAQVAPNRATAYLPVTDVGDVRALWVNPAGLGAREEAAVLLDLTVQDPGADGRLTQVSTGFNARGLAFGYQRDNFSNGIHGHTWRFGLGGGRGRFSVGAVLALYRGATKGTGWDLGVCYDWLPQLTIGGVVRNLGTPTVRGVELKPTYLPAVTARTATDQLALTAQAEATASTVLGYVFELRAAPARSRLSILARVDTDRGLHRRSLVLGLSLGRTDRLGLVGSSTGSDARQNVLSGYGVAVRAPWSSGR